MTIIDGAAGYLALLAACAELAAAQAQGRGIGSVPGDGTCD
eukprot:COSAG04_NODE_14885_length_551_cov_1.230088_2_plen_40_part_01